MRQARNWALVLGLLLILTMVAMTLVGILYTPHNPTRIAVANRFISPSPEYWFGTDQYGRDVLSRVMVGGQVSLMVGFTAVVSGLVIGCALGAVSGYYGKWWDELLMRVADGFYALPAFLMALLAVTIWGPGRNTALVAIAVANVPIFMRVTRSAFLSLREQQYVEAAKAIGATDCRVILFHLLPNASTPLLVQASVNFAGAVLAEASLSYLGVGTQPPMASWGRMLRESQSFAGLAPWNVIFPGLAIALTVLGFNLLGDGLRQLGHRR